MANEFIARKGLIVLSNGAKVTGSLEINGAVSSSIGFSGSGANIFGVVSSSFATTSSLALNNITTASVNTNIITFTRGDGSSFDIEISQSGSVESASFATNAATASYVEYNNVANKPTLISSSAQVSYTDISNIPSGIVSASSQIDHNATTNYVANQHIDHSVVSISAGSGLSGGGDITTTRTLTLDTSSAHFTNGVKNKLDADGVLSSSSQITSFATTGSNTFTGIQTVNDTTNSTNFANGAVVIAGGLGVAKDVNISGSLTVTGLLTAVSMSTQYVTSSQYTIGTSRVVVNDDDLVRFAGLSVMDSGSTPASGSILWDSLRNHFIYETDDIHNGNVDPHSALIIAGPETYNNVGNEISLISGRVPIATTDHNIDNRPESSSIRIIPGTLQTHIEAGLYITGSVTSSVGFSGDGSQLTGIASTLSQITANGATTTTQVELNGGAIIHGVLYSSGSNTDVDTGTEVVATFPTGSYDAAHFDYVVKKSGNLRTGTVMVVWQSGTTNVEHTDTSTNDIGNTEEVIFTADTLLGNVRLLATVSSTDWNIKTSAKLI
jgi:hypothetical protein